MVSHDDDFSGVIDCDVHIHEDPVDMAPYCEMPWRRSLEQHTASERWLDTPGYAPITPLDPIVSSVPDQPPYVVLSANQLRTDLDTAGVEAAVVLPDRLVTLGGSQNADYARCVSAAYNRYLVDRWLDPARGLFGAILLPTQDVPAAVDGLRTHAGTAGVVAGLLSTVHTYPLLGDRTYDPIFATAQETDTPLICHGAITYGTVFPYELQGFESPLARAGLAQPLGAIASLTNMVTTGVFARFPNLRVIFCEAGLAWLPFVSNALDAQYPFLREDTPELTELPSAYIRRQVWVTAHPLPELFPAASFANLSQLIGDDRILFASDWPHYDRVPTEALSLLVPDAAQRRLLSSETARALFRLNKPVTAPY